MSAWVWEQTLVPRQSGLPEFNYQFFIYLLISGLLSIFFLLYFNRLFGSIVSYAIRTWTWHRYNVHIDIKALQVSLLAGRVFFSGLRYHGVNESFLIQHGDITLRYWLRRVREADVLDDKHSQGKRPSKTGNNSKLPCRINVSLVGLEWFVYNRSPAYEGVLAGLKDADTARSSSNDVDQEKASETGKTRKRSLYGLDQLEEIFPPSRNGRPVTGRHDSSRDADSVDGVAAGSTEPEIPFILQWLPVYIECRTAAAVIGNDNTKAILVVKANGLTCHVDARATRTVDPYRQSFDVDFDHPVIEIKDNDDFKEDQPTRATKEREIGIHFSSQPRRTWFRHRRRKFVSSLRNMVPYWRRSVESFSADSRADLGSRASHPPGSNRWQGLSRYLDDRDQDDKARWGSVEYAAVTTIMDSPSAHLQVYWDAVAKVTRRDSRPGTADSLLHVNGGNAPAWGMHFQIRGGTMNYGPWADRQRADLQRVFLPGLAKDATPAKPLAPGEWRVATEFNLLIELDDTVTVRIPIREESKNWRWRGKEPPVNQQGATKRKQRNKAKKKGKSDVNQTRPAGWLELKIPVNSSMEYSMDMLARSGGYKNTLLVDLPTSELWSSVNHDLLWRSGHQRIICDLSNPLGWNTLRNWHFNIISDDMKLYLLRDHIFLLLDLVNDWATGPPSDYLIFTPFNYHLHLKLRELQAYINVNDGNVIDNATALDENNFLILSTPILNTEATIPLDKYIPEKNSIPFDIRAETLTLSVRTPQWNTESAFLDSGLLGNAEGLVVSGSYQYNASTSAANTDTLLLNVYGQSPHVTVHGFLIRYLMLLKDNYFGETVHFRTVDEYQEQLQSKANGDGDAHMLPPIKKSNDLDVILSVKVDDPQIAVPTNLYSAKRYIQGELASLAVDLRFTNYYMDLELDLSPLSLSLGMGDQNDSPSLSTSNTQLFIDGIRVFGYRAFGLPPTEPTYLCNWDVSVGAVRGGCNAEFLSALTKGASAFGFTFDDVENALVPYSSLIFHDITFIRAQVEAISLWIHLPDAAFLMSTGTIDVNSNDWARSHYSKRANVIVPNIQISCIDAESAAEHKSRHQHPVKTDAYLHMDVQLGSIGRKVNFSEERKTQQELVRREDQRTDRTPFLIYDELLDEFIPEPVDAPAQCTPPPPYPVDEVEAENESVGSFRSSSSVHKLRRQSSFLSFASSGSGSSVRRRGTATQAPNRPPQKKPSSSNQFQALSYAASTSAAQDTRHRSYSHPAVTFSSPYFAPHFSMDGIQPDLRELGTLDLDDADWDDPFQNPSTQLCDVDPRSISEEFAYSGAIVEIPSGITAFVSPQAVKHVTALLEVLQPNTPEDILDSLQVDSIKEIYGAKQRGDAAGNINDLLVRLPGAQVRFLNTSTLDSPDSSSEETDRYDLQLSNISLVTRNVQERNDGSARPKKSRTSLQLRMSHAEISATERLAAVSKAQAAVMVQIDQVLVSMGSKDVTYLDADIGSVVGSTASGDIEYLAALIHRTGNVASELSHLLAESSKRQENRLQYCCCRLVELGRSTNDPPFLIRPSAVLRSVDKHLRTVDSWKLAMRLRQIWTLLPEADKIGLAQACSTGTEQLPPNATEKVVEAFQHWRSWDLEDSRRTVLLQKVFGSMKTPVEQQGDERPFLSACCLGELQFILDPGPKQNRVAVQDLTCRFERKLDPSLGKQLGIHVADDLLNTIDISCAQVHVDLNWELLELGQTVLKLYNRSQPASTTIHKITKPKVADKGASRMALHVFFEIRKSSFTLETINLRSSNVLSGFKSSALLYRLESGREFSSLMLNCDAVTARLHSHSSLLWTCQLLYPSVTVSQEIPEVKAQPVNVIKGAASSRGLSFVVEKDIMGLLETVDLVVRDEGAQLAHLQKQIPTPQKKTRSPDIPDQLSSLQINVVMFLDGYSVSVPLLQSLTYKVSGVVARAAFSANHGKELVFDFDVKDNSHDIQMNVNNKLQSISILQIPPTNGRVTTHMGESERTINVLSSIEIVRLDASAIYSLLTAVNRPQINAEIEDIQEQFKSIQQHVNELSEPGQPKPSTGAASNAKTAASLPIIYDIHLTLAGFQALTKTTFKRPEEPFAQLLFALDKFHLQASNRDASSGAIMKYPELRLNLQNIGLDVRRGHEGNTRSCGNLGASVTVSAGSRRSPDGKDEWIFNFMSDDLHVILSPETVSTVIDILGYMSSRIKDLDTSRELEYLRKLRQSKPRISINDDAASISDEEDLLDSVLSSVVYRFQLRNIRASWDVAKEADHTSDEKEDLHFSISLIEFGTRSRKSARLTIEDLQLQMVPPGHEPGTRSLHSALLPEVTFNVAYVSTSDARRLAFQAIGKSLDLRLTSAFILPAANLVQSISLSAKNVQEAYAQWIPDTVQVSPTKELVEATSIKQKSILGNKRLESLLLDADFAGAVVHVSGGHAAQSHEGPSIGGKYGQFNVDDSGSSAVLRSPGLAFKGEFRDDGKADPSLYGEAKIDASENILYPSVVPLVLDILSNIKDVVSDKDEEQKALAPPKLKPQKTGEEDNLLTADPSTVIGRLKLNLGLRICQQKFSLSCQPIARVAATTSFDHFYLAFNTITSQEHGDFFAISGVLTKPQASVKHVYSREPTASFALDTVTLSLMNSKHVSGISGVSAILNVSPMAISVNARQAPDFLLFREIWYPEELRRADSAPVAKLETETSQVHLVQRYQQVAATAAFPWTATVSIAALDVSIDLGQSIGKSVFQIQEFWVSSKKTSDWEQNLCLGFRKIGIDSTGRLSGFVALQHFRLRTSIQWPKREEALNETPLVQASLAFKALQIKAAFDYQAFLVGDVTSLEFLMYNVRETRQGSGDRLVAIFNGDAIQLFGTTSSGAQGVAAYRALKKLVQENKESYEASLKEIEKSINRKSIGGRSSLQPRRTIPKLPESDTMSKSPISLDTDVVVTLRALNLGVFPSTFSDHQVFKMEALDAYARFAASMKERKIHSLLRMTLGQLRVGLAGVRNVEAPRTLSEMQVEDVVQRSTGSRGGTILKVPCVEAVMETWQSPSTNHIDYKFKSAFEGKVEVGWNYSRISYIRGMLANHNKSLEQVWGRQLPLTAVKITGVPGLSPKQSMESLGGGGGEEADEEMPPSGQQGKITAEVTVPQSKYDYTALEEPIIETPQLRDMGEATPPLEWIGLQRDRLPNLTHQIVIVPLLELAGEVEDAYERILGSS
ncbi:fermentation associated protein [Cordyceps fumosorosea ARSEF 2679]|uniref:Fermentation associated protein n=1 Tax=Cordyceps fumosorosea (strain ARSEF 2679) TaxID=1081104 RepID=A0A167V8J8_CORFA|nr:fermentation associated protein [Cordyceps fumosorosea ARSEF 2679]OAA62344.1 fermentation associated protein [Cordyceps fumosorosea ARSEF 2679]